MENEGRIVELGAEMLIKFDTQTNEFKGLREEFRGLRVDLNTQLEHVENKLEKVESEMVKLNLISLRKLTRAA